MSKLKVYVWQDIQCDYTCGIAVGIATTKLGAIKAIMGEEYPSKKNNYFKGWLYDELIGIEPEILNIEDIKSVGWYVSGGG